MLVKCPRCRLRFDVPASPGIRELQCNCPRCGQPFTYTIEDDASSASADNPSGVEGGSAASVGQADEGRKGGPSTQSSPSASGRVVPPPIPPHQGRGPANRDAWQGNRSARGGAWQQNGSSRRDSQQDIPSGYGTPAMPVKPEHTGCLMRILMIVVGIVAVIVIFQRQCSSHDKSYTIKDVGTVEQTEQADSNDEAQQVVAPDPQFDERVGAEKAPAWIQGNWYANTDYGGISVKIYGDNIAETTGDETSYGHYRYQNQYLFCDFGDGETFYYHLDMENQRIDAGHGIIMKKRTE